MTDEVKSWLYNPDSTVIRKEEAIGLLSNLFTTMDDKWEIRRLINQQSDIIQKMDMELQTLLTKLKRMDETIERQIEMISEREETIRKLEKDIGQLMATMVEDQLIK